MSADTVESILAVIFFAIVTVATYYLFYIPGRKKGSDAIEVYLRALPVDVLSEVYVIKTVRGLGVGKSGLWDLVNTAHVMRVQQGGIVLKSPWWDKLQDYSFDADHYNWNKSKLISLDILDNFTVLAKGTQALECRREIMSWKLYPNYDAINQLRRELQSKGIQEQKEN